MINIVLDMETNDPDDFLTLLLLLGHPKVNLKAVTVMPGSPYQVGLVRYALSLFAKDIPIGAYNISHEKKCVSNWHYKAYGNIPAFYEAEEGGEILLRYCDEKTTLVTGAPLKNVRIAMNKNFKVGKLFAQGGFAGEGVIPREQQLPKFKGMVTCPTFNLNGDPKAALRVLEYSQIGIRHFVSKNVCHGVHYNRQMHDHFAMIKDKSLSLQLIYKGMEVYLKKSQGKKLHDPLAACCAIDDSIASWAEVQLYREKGEWGARLCPGSNTWIITSYNHELFLQILTKYN